MNSFKLIFSIHFFLIILKYVKSCGQAQEVTSKIIGGETVSEIKYPWFVVIALKRLVSNIQPLCGGSLISSKHVLTAAHCVEGQNFKYKYAVYANIQNYCTDLSFGDKRTIKRVIIHPNYYNFNNDIAIISLKRSLNYEPICLPEPYSTLPNYGQVIGFGVSNELGHSKCDLQSVILPTHDQLECEYVWASYHDIQDGSFCAGVLEGGKDACYGDSGGPFQQKDSNNIYTLFGIVSFGLECAQPDILGVYANVQYYYYWIHKYI